MHPGRQCMVRVAGDTWLCFFQPNRTNNNPANHNGLLEFFFCSGQDELA